MHHRAAAPTLQMSLPSTQFSSAPSTPGSAASAQFQHVAHHHAHQRHMPYELDSRGSVISSAGSVESTFQVQAYATYDGGFPTVALDAASFTSSTPSSEHGHGDVASPQQSPALNAASQATGTNGLPRGTVHTALSGNVCFIPYPQTVGEVQRFLTQCSAQRAEYARQGYNVGPRDCRVFVGQLPYGVTEMQLLWICNYFGGDVSQPQRITKTNDAGERIPTGAVHVMCDRQSYENLLQHLHKRVLVDDTGLWFAQTPEQKVNLDSYVQYLHQNKKSRKAGRPYESVVVQFAQSTFVPRRAMQFDSTRR